MLSNKEIVAGVVAAFNQRDPEQLASFIAPDGVADWRNSIAPYRGVYRGRDAWREFFEQRLSAWEEAIWEVDEITELDEDRILLVIRLLARGREESGIEVTAAGAVSWTLADGAVTRATLFQSREEAIPSEGHRD